MVRRAGFSLLEIMVALAIMSLVALGLASAISSSQRMTSFSRERATAENAIRAYIEAMRTKKTSQVLADTSTPADYLPSANALKNATGEVFKVNYENGTKGTLVTGTYQSANAATANTTPTQTPAWATTVDAAALAFTSTGRDLDGDGVNTSNPASKLLVLPVRIKLTWTSYAGGSDPSAAATNLGGTQTMVAYVCFTSP